MHKAYWSDWDKDKSWLVIDGSFTAGMSPVIWLDERDGRWCSNCPPINGSWESMVDAQIAITQRLRQKYADILASLPSDEEIGVQVRREIA